MNTAVLHPSADPPLPLAVHVLGRFAVSIGTAEVPADQWPSLRAAHLVQLLSLQSRHRMNRDHVIDALWPQLDPQAGAANLRKATHHARQALGRHDAIVVQGGELALWPERPLTVDAHVFSRLAAAALAGRDAAECAEAARAYTGDLLPGARYETWTEVARERLQASHLDLLRASAQWDKLAQLEPTDEPAHRALMQRELEAGNRAAALRWYAHLREALQQSLAVLPDRQTEALYERCLAGLQSSGPAFVGRALELAQLTAWLGAAGDERPGCIVLSGPGGIGKSALCREIGSQARDRGWSVLRIDVTHSGRAYAVVSGIVERLLLADRGLLDRIGTGAAVRRARPSARPAQVARAVRRSVRRCHHRGARRPRAGCADDRRGRLPERGRAGAVGQSLPVRARAGPPGTRRPDSAPSPRGHAPAHRRTADRAGRWTGRHRTALAEGGQVPRCRGVAAGRGTRCGTGGCVRRRLAPSRAAACLRAASPRGSAAARRVARREG